MSTLNTILEAEREAQRITDAARTEADEIVRSAKVAQEKELSDTKQALAKKHEDELATHESTLATQIEEVEREANNTVHEIEERARTQHAAAVTSVVHAFTPSRSNT